MASSSQPASPLFVPRGRHLFVYDLVAIAVSIVTAFTLRFDARDPVGFVQFFAPASLTPLVIQPLVNVAFGLYRREWRYASIRELIAICAAIATGTALSAVVFLGLTSINFPGTDGLPRSFYALEGLVSLLLVGGGRFALRIVLENIGRSGETDAEAGVIRSLVYGAGEAGTTLARLAKRDRSVGIEVVGFLDDDPNKRGSRLYGERIYGSLDDLATAVRQRRASQLVVAMPSAPGAQIRMAVDHAQELGLQVRIVPPLDELLGDADRLRRLRPVRLEDLLRREPAIADHERLAQYLNATSVLVTGGGGSIGSELVRQILALGPRRLTILDQSEVGLWDIERETANRRAGDRIGIDIVLADVRSPAEVDRAIDRAEPDVVFHAAALKHVPMCEQHPAAAVMTNVVGTRNVLSACERQRVGQFVLISTDKAVQPVSVMGSTKRLAELLTVDAAARLGRAYAAVRFGNVLGSSGSVVPIFHDQLARGGPLTITDVEATRYFMTIPEAVTLILEAGSDAAPGEIYVLDMGEPVRVLDLARDMIRLSGLPPDSVEIQVIGLRPGERLHERLFFDHESVAPTGHDRVLRTLATGARQIAGSPVELAAELEALAARSDDRAVRERLMASGALRPAEAVSGVHA
jgi:FlaA1/EpsC-like NDP-sugar epimerase